LNSKENRRLKSLSFSYTIKINQSEKET